jgi:hypothetical protein
VRVSFRQQANTMGIFVVAALAANAATPVDGPLLRLNVFDVTGVGDRRWRCGRIPILGAAKLEGPAWVRAIITANSRHAARAGMRLRRT